MSVQIIDAAASTVENIPGVLDQWRLTVPQNIPAGDVIAVVIKHTQYGGVDGPLPIPKWTGVSCSQYDYSVPSPWPREIIAIYLRAKSPNDNNTYNFAMMELYNPVVLKTFAISGARRSLGGVSTAQTSQLLDGSNLALTAYFNDVAPDTVVDGGAGLMVLLGNDLASASAITAYPAAMRDALNGYDPRYFLGVEHFTVDESHPVTRSFTATQTGVPWGGSTYEGFTGVAVTFAPAFNTSMFHGVQF